MFSKFEEWYRDRHDYARAWKEKSSGKVFGCFCSYVPEEILVAANILPVRVLGSHEPQDVTEPHLFGMFCPFCRDVLAQGLKGRYEYLDGITLAQSCIHLRQAYRSWEQHVDQPFSYYLPHPMSVQSPAAVPYLREELENYKKAVEEFTGSKITNDDLDRGIRILNENREAMHELYKHRIGPEPKLSGKEAMWVTVSSTWIDKEEHTAEIRRVLKLIEEREMDRECGAKLMFVGSENDDIEFINMVESVGATVVVDDHCTGTRYFWNSTADDMNDRIEAIAKRYVERPACPSKDHPVRTRFPHILKLAKDFDVQGVILIQQKFCDPHEADMVPLRKYLEENDIPCLFLEFDVTVPLGPFRIRVEAFLEMVGEEDLF
ncbi:MAG: benzoyl-CoA reductase, bzd-type, subunit N [Candidatus Electryonea clarkiae]|nr:benzoyl-CoA reductase, bzd-type, subunit N [Candidatus Electryonea clarkiae]MDP8287613.1 benzoyl-CoA reductase, bzd-type, subunit N [Candidatus Electryonea clarkiae]